MGKKVFSSFRHSPQEVAGRAGDLARRWPELDTTKQHEFVRNILKQVVVGQATVRIDIEQSKLLAALFEKAPKSSQHLPKGKNGILSLTGDFRVLRRGREIRVIAPANGSSPEAMPVPSVVKAVARARDWYERIVAGEIKTMSQLAHESGLRRRYIRQILRCATMSPQITEALLLGKHRANLTLKEILGSMPLDWREQVATILR